MNFTSALECLNDSLLIKLPEWEGYWGYNKNLSMDITQVNLSCIYVVTKEGDILYTPNIDEYKDRTDWECTNGVSFGIAIKGLVKGNMAYRKGWNGKSMFIFMRPEDTLSVDIISNVKSLPEKVKSMLVNRGTSIKFLPYLCMFTATQEIVNGWLASQTDILANDYRLI